MVQQPMPHGLIQKRASPASGVATQQMQQHQMPSAQ